MRRPFASAEKYGLGLYNDMTGQPEATQSWLGWINNFFPFVDTLVINHPRSFHIRNLFYLGKADVYWVKSAFVSKSNCSF